MEVQIPGFSSTLNPLYNLVPPPGFAASFGFSSLELTGFAQGSLRTGRDYGFTEVVAPVANGALQSISETIWGVPADPSHNSERICYQSDGTKIEGCASGSQPSPFLTLPATCDRPVEIRVVAESIRGVVATKTASLLGPDGEPALLTGCDEVPFKPQAAVGLTSSSADTPTGATVQVHLPQPSGAGTLAEAPLRNAVIHFPEGMAVNPSAAAGLQACTRAQIGLESPPGQAPGEFTAAPANCPDAAKIGSLELDTLLIDHPLQGPVYLAAPHDNPFGSLLAVYLTVDDEESGVVLKLPAAIDADPVSGRLTLRLQDAPQLPVEDLRISLPSGPRALFRTPLSCGEAVATGKFAPWSTPQKPVEFSDPLSISTPAGGAGTCPANETEAPAAASFEGGTLNPAAGRASSLLLKVSRVDGSQRLARIEATLPPGVAATLAGVPVCSDMAVALNACPAASKVGAVNVAAGAGSLPLHLGGSVFLAGAYQEAPFSLEVAVPAIAGPFDLGNLNLRVPLHVDPRTAQIHAVSDELPMILEGIPLDIRSVAIDLDRPGFLRNPTSCDPTAITAGVTTVAGRAVAMSDRFQVGGCAALPFKPKLAVRLLGSSMRGAHPRVRATLRPPEGSANIERMDVSLPGSELLDAKRIGAICTLPAAEIANCPAASAVAHLQVRTPLLSAPLAGSVFLRPSPGRLPGLTAVLDGAFQLRLSGHLASAHGHVRLGFDNLPDVPFEALTLQVAGGRHGILVNSGGVCRGSRRLKAVLGAHSGRVREMSPRLRARCPARAGR